MKLRSLSAVFAVVVCLLPVAASADDFQDFKTSLTSIQGPLKLTIGFNGRPAIGEKASLRVSMGYLVPDSTARAYSNLTAVVTNDRVAVETAGQNGAPPYLDIWGSWIEFRAASSGKYELRVTGTVGIETRGTFNAVTKNEIPIDLYVQLFTIPEDRPITKPSVARVKGPRQIQIRKDDYRSYVFTLTVRDPDHVVDRFEFFLRGEGPDAQTETKTMNGWIIRLRYEIPPLSPAQWNRTAGTVRELLQLSLHDDELSDWQSRRAETVYGAYRIDFKK